MLILCMTLSSKSCGLLNTQARVLSNNKVINYIFRKKKNCNLFRKKKNNIADVTTPRAHSRARVRAGSWAIPLNWAASNRAIASPTPIVRAQRLASRIPAGTPATRQTFADGTPSAWCNVTFHTASAPVKPPGTQE